MAFVLYSTNDNTFRISPVTRESDGVTETDVVFAVTLYDKNGDPVSGVTGIETAYRSAKRDNAVVIAGSDVDGLEEGAGYHIECPAIDSYADKITFEDIPAFVAKRRG